MPAPFLTHQRIAALLAAMIASIIFGLAAAGGTYADTRWSIVGALVWWTLAGAVLAGMGPGLGRETAVVGTLLLLYALWIMLSASWAADRETVWEEAGRALVYVGAFALVAIAATRSKLTAWSDGLAFGIGGVGLLSLLSRLFPGLFHEGDLLYFLPGSEPRLSYPLGYWNGLGILLALGVPLLVRAAADGRHAALRVLSAALLPPLLAALYLTSSRGGAIAAFLGTVTLLALAPRCWAVLGTIIGSLVGAAAAIAVLHARPDLVNRPATSAQAAAEGRSAALLLLLITLATAGGFALFVRSGLRLRPPRWVGRATWATFALIAIAALAAGHPRERFEAFKRPALALDAKDPIDQHLLSGAGTGRWQSWAAAVHEWQRSPIHGGGAGSYEAWWAAHGTLPIYVRDAHSVYVEALAELGLVGFGLIVAALGGALLLATRLALRAKGEERSVRAALVAAGAGYAVAAGVDWMWELPAVTLTAMIALACALVPRSAPVRLRRWPRWPVAVAAASVAIAVSGMEGGIYLERSYVASSQRAVAQGNTAAARQNAARATRFVPWPASARLQQGLVAEQTGDFRLALKFLHSATLDDHDDWRLWLVQTRLETKAGAIRAAARSLRHARDLDPRSPLFRNFGTLGGQGP